MVPMNVLAATIGQVLGSPLHPTHAITQAVGGEGPLPTELTLRYDASINQTVGVPLQITGTVNIDWGDGTNENVTGNGWKTHTYSDTAVHDVTITGTVIQIWHSVLPTTEYDALTRVVSWGSQALTRIWFYGAANLTSVPTTLPATVTSLNETFKGCAAFNSSAVSNWDVSAVTDMTETFRECDVFNQPLNWSAPFCNNFQRMVGSSPLFNQDVSFVGNPSDASVLGIDCADFANGCTAFTGQGVDEWGWEKITGIANLLLQCPAADVDLSACEPLICTNAANAFAFAGTDPGCDLRIPLDWPALTNAAGMLKSSGITQNLAGMQIPNVTTANAMCQLMADNTSNLSQWCVTNLASRPTLFADDSGITVEPVWGTCPVPNFVAPTLSSATATADGAYGADLSVSTDEGNGMLYWFVSTSATPPSASTLKAGTGAVDFGNQAVSGTGVQNATADSLTAATAYYAYFLHADTVGNESNIVSDGFTTDAAPAFLPPDIASCVVWLDESDLDTVWQNAARSTPGAVDSIVMYMDDKSGNGNDFHQTNSALAPTLRESGGKYYLDHTGGKFLQSVTKLDLSGTDAVTASLGIYKATDAAAVRILDLDTAASATAAFTMSAPSSPGTTRYSVTSQGSGSLAGAQGTTFAAPTTNLVTGLFDISTDTCILRVDGAQVATGATDQGSGNFKNGILYLGQRANGGSRHTGYTYQLTVFSAVLSGSDLTNLETFIDGKMP